MVVKLGLWPSAHLCGPIFLPAYHRLYSMAGRVPHRHPLEGSASALSLSGGLTTPPFALSLALTRRRHQIGAGLWIFTSPPGLADFRAPCISALPCIN